MFIASVNEGSQLPLEIALRGPTRAETVPTTLRYRVDCKTTGQAITGWTSLTPAASVSLTIPAQSNAIIRNMNRYEVKALTLQADAGLSTAYTSEHQWKVINLEGIS